LGYFAYWNQNCQLWNWDSKPIQFEIKFQFSKFLGYDAYWDKNHKLPKTRGCEISTWKLVQFESRLRNPDQNCP
jgi:hypothetical protein